MAESMEKFAERFFEALHSNDREKRAAFFSDEPYYISGGPVRGSRYTGKKAVLDAMERAGTIFDVEMEKSERKLIITKDHIMMQFHVVGKSKVTDRPYANELLFIYEVKNGKVRSMREYLDTIAAARATGDLPYPD